MVLRLAFLIGSLLLGTSSWGAVSRCLDCHPTHYGDRGSCTDCHGGNPGTDRVDVAHYDLVPGRFSYFTLPEHPVTARGQKRIEVSGCRRCHLTSGKGNRLASDLDRTGLSPGELFQAIESPVLYMPDFRFSEDHMVEVVNAILGGGSKVESGPGERPLVIHFEEKSREPDPFSKHCGACHRVLTARRGGLGEGRVAPDLSGLFTEFYPGSFKEGEPWGPETLTKWLKNPRKTRAQARMAPVLLEEKELQGLLEILLDGRDPEPQVPFDSFITTK